MFQVLKIIYSYLHYKNDNLNTNQCVLLKTILKNILNAMFEIGL